MARRFALLLLVPAVLALLWWTARRDRSPRAAPASAAAVSEAPLVTIAPSELATPELVPAPTAPERVRAPASDEERAVARARGGILRGHVVDDQQRPVAGALVRGWCSREYDPRRAPERRVRTDELGAFEVRDLGPEFALDAVADGLACRQGLRGKLAFGTVAEGELVLVLARAATVSGRVIGPDGEGVPARMDVNAPGSWSSMDATAAAGVSRFTPVVWRGNADAEGRFTLPEVPEGGTYTVSVRCAGYVSGYAHFSAASSPLEIRMDTGASVVGRVVGPGGEPLPGALVEAGGEDIESARTTTRDDGTFTLGGIGKGTTAYVVATAKGHAPGIVEGIALAPKTPARADFALERGFTLAGRVIDAKGAPLAGARVTLEGDRTYARGYDSDEPATLERLAGRGETHTGDDGAFRIDDLYLGNFLVRVYGPEGGDVHVEVRVQTPVGDLLVRFDAAALGRVVLAGSVRDSLTGEPIRAFTLSPMIVDENGASGTNRPVDAPDGRFRIAGIDPGPMYFTVTAPGYASWTSAVEELGDGVHEYDVRLGPLRSLALEVRQADGSPVTGRIRAQFTQLDGRVQWIDSSLSGSTTHAEMRDGIGKVSGLPADRLRVTFDVSELGEETFDLDLRVQPTAPIVFRLSGSTGKDFSVFLFVDALVPGTAPGDLERMDEAELLRHVALPDAAIEILALDDRGETLLTAKITPTDEGWSTEASLLARGQSSQSTAPRPRLSATLPGRSRTLVVRAAGYAEQRLTLDPARENGGLTRFVLLER